MKDGFVFYRSFWECLKELDAETQASVLRALCEYALDEIEPASAGISTAIFRLMKPQVDANSRRYENGKKGGRPKTKQDEEGTENNLDVTKHEPNVTEPEPKEKDKVKDKDKVKEKEKDKEKDKVKDKDIGVCVERRAPFRPPTVEQVRDYCKERGNHVDAERFVDFYAAKNWMIGKNKMIDWKAAVRTWEKDSGRYSAGKQNTFQYQGRQRSEDEFSSLETQMLGASSRYAEGETA